MSKDYDVCVIGSGAGGGPVALTLAQAGYAVLVLEKGPWFSEQDFYKDELACCRRSVYTPELEDEQHVIEDLDSHGDWVGEATSCLLYTSPSPRDQLQHRVCRLLLE